MPDFKAIYDRLRESGMNDWVGGADPEAVGESCFSVLARHLPIDSSTRVLDFGSGIGRVALAVLRNRPQLQSLTGIDIVPKMVRFCRDTIVPAFPNTGFELLTEHNDHYERFKDGQQGKSRTAITREHGGSFDAAYAFSVFTHIDIEDFAPLLRFVGTLLKPGGYFCFTAFILTPFSRLTLHKKWTIPQFEKPVYERSDQVFIGNSADRLAFIAYDVSRIEKMILEAGLISCTIEYGEWRGGGVAQSYQDVIVCRKPFEWKG